MPTPSRLKGARLLAGPRSTSTTKARLLLTFAAIVVVVVVLGSSVAAAAAATKAATTTTTTTTSSTDPRVVVVVGSSSSSTSITSTDSEPASPAPIASAAPSSFLAAALQTSSQLNISNTGAHLASSSHYHSDPIERARATSSRVASGNSSSSLEQRPTHLPSTSTSPPSSPPSSPSSSSSSSAFFVTKNSILLQTNTSNAAARSKTTTTTTATNDTDNDHANEKYANKAQYYLPPAGAEHLAASVCCKTSVLEAPADDKEPAASGRRAPNNKTTSNNDSYGGRGNDTMKEPSAGARDSGQAEAGDNERRLAGERLESAATWPRITYANKAPKPLALEKVQVPWPMQMAVATPGGAEEAAKATLAIHQPPQPQLAMSSEPPPATKPVRAPDNGDQQDKDGPNDRLGATQQQQAHFTDHLASEGRLATAAGGGRANSAPGDAIAAVESFEDEDDEAFYEDDEDDDDDVSDDPEDAGDEQLQEDVHESGDEQSDGGEQAADSWRQAARQISRRNSPPEVGPGPEPGAAQVENRTGRLMETTTTTTGDGDTYFYSERRIIKRRRQRVNSGADKPTISGSLSAVPSNGKANDLLVASEDDTQDDQDEQTDDYQDYGAYLLKLPASGPAASVAELEPGQGSALANLRSTGWPLINSTQADGASADEYRFSGAGTKFELEEMALDEPDQVQIPASSSNANFTSSKQDQKRDERVNLAPQSEQTKLKYISQKQPRSGHPKKSWLDKLDKKKKREKSVDGGDMFLSAALLSLFNGETKAPTDGQHNEKQSVHILDHYRVHDRALGASLVPPAKDQHQQQQIMINDDDERPQVFVGGAHSDSLEQQTYGQNNDFGELGNIPAVSRGTVMVAERAAAAGIKRQRQQQVDFARDQLDHRRQHDHNNNNQIDTGALLKGDPTSETAACNPAQSCQARKQTVGKQQEQQNKLDKQAQLDSSRRLANHTAHFNSHGASSAAESSFGAKLRADPKDDFSAGSRPKIITSERLAPLASRRELVGARRLLERDNGPRPVVVVDGNDDDAGVEQAARPDVEAELDDNDDDDERWLAKIGAISDGEEATDARAEGADEVEEQPTLNQQHISTDQLDKRAKNFQRSTDKSTPNANKTTTDNNGQLHNNDAADDEHSAGSSSAIMSPAPDAASSTSSVGGASSQLAMHEQQQQQQHNGSPAGAQPESSATLSCANCNKTANSIMTPTAPANQAKPGHQQESGCSPAESTQCQDDDLAEEMMNQDDQSESVTKLANSVSANQVSSELEVEDSGQLTGDEPGRDHQLSAAEAGDLQPPDANLWADLEQEANKASSSVLDNTDNLSEEEQDDVEVIEPSEFIRLSERQIAPAANKSSDDGFNKLLLTADSMSSSIIGAQNSSSGRETGGWPSERPPRVANASLASGGKLAGESREAGAKLAPATSNQLAALAAAPMESLAAGHLNASLALKQKQQQQQASLSEFANNNISMMPLMMQHHHDKGPNEYGGFGGVARSVLASLLGGLMGSDNHQHAKHQHEQQQQLEPARTIAGQLVNDNRTIQNSTTTTRANFAMSQPKYKLDKQQSSSSLNASNAAMELEQANSEPVIRYWHLFWVTLPVGATFGNLLVIMAVYLERSLQSVTNYFIVSLAFADLSVGLIVMPFAVYALVNPLWDIGDQICDFYIAVDVTSSTASILNLVAISIDRYRAVAHPIAYGSRQSSNRAILTILLVWFISCCVGAPIFLGLNNTENRDHSVCVLNHDAFIFWSSIASFYVPCVVMVGLYSRIFAAIRSRAKKAIQAANPADHHGAKEQHAKHEHHHHHHEPAANQLTPKQHHNVSSPAKNVNNNNGEQEALKREPSAALDTPSPSTPIPRLAIAAAVAPSPLVGANLRPINGKRASRRRKRHQQQQQNLHQGADFNGEDGDLEADLEHEPALDLESGVSRQFVNSISVITNTSRSQQDTSQYNMEPTTSSSSQDNNNNKQQGLANLVAPASGSAAPFWRQSQMVGIKGGFSRLSRRLRSSFKQTNKSTIIKTTSNQDANLVPVAEPLASTAQDEVRFTLKAQPDKCDQVNKLQIARQYRPSNKQTIELSHVYSSFCDHLIRAVNLSKPNKCLGLDWSSNQADRASSRVDCKLLIGKSINEPKFEDESLLLSVVSSICEQTLLHSTSGQMLVVYSSSEDDTRFEQVMKLLTPRNDPLSCSICCQPVEAKPIKSRRCTMNVKLDHSLTNSLMISVDQDLQPNTLACYQMLHKANQSATTLTCWNIEDMQDVLAGHTVCHEDTLHLSFECKLLQSPSKVINGEHTFKICDNCKITNRATIVDFTQVNLQPLDSSEQVDFGCKQAGHDDDVTEEGQMNNSGSRINVNCNHCYHLLPKKKDDKRQQCTSSVEWIGQTLCQPTTRSSSSSASSSASSSVAPPRSRSMSSRSSSESSSLRSHDSSSSPEDEEDALSDDDDESLGSADYVAEDNEGETKVRRRRRHLNKKRTRDEKPSFVSRNFISKLTGKKLKQTLCRQSSSLSLGAECVGRPGIVGKRHLSERAACSCTSPPLRLSASSRQVNDALRPDRLFANLHNGEGEQKSNSKLLCPRHAPAGKQHSASAFLTSSLAQTNTLIGASILSESFNRQLESIAQRHSMSAMGSGLSMNHDDEEDEPSTLITNRQISSSLRATSTSKCHMVNSKGLDEMPRSQVDVRVDATLVTDQPATIISKSSDHSNKSSKKSFGKQSEDPGALVNLVIQQQQNQKKSSSSSFKKKALNLNVVARNDQHHENEKANDVSEIHSHVTYSDFIERSQNTTTVIIGPVESTKSSSQNNEKSTTMSMPLSSKATTQMAQQSGVGHTGGGGRGGAVSSSSGNTGQRATFNRKRRERNAARRERKATKTLAIVMGIFLVCWSPFFTCNIIDGLFLYFYNNHFVSPQVYQLVSWIGYINSCVNPIIYTIFNMEFRRAFKRILSSGANCFKLRSH